MAKKRSSNMSNSARVMRIIVGFLGVGVAVAALFAIVLSLNSNFDFRSEAARQKKTVRKTCYPWGSRPIKCDVGYDCFAKENTHASPARNKWGVCVKKEVKPTPTPKTIRCNTTIKPAVLCPKGYTCQYSTSDGSSFKAGGWGVCKPEIVYGGCNLSANPPRTCQAGYYCKPDARCESVSTDSKTNVVNCIKGEGTCVKAEVSPQPTQTLCKTGVNSFSVDTSCGTDLFRYASYTCYDGSSVRSGGSTSCKSSAAWSLYAKEYCMNKSNCPSSTEIPTPVFKEPAY